MAARWVLRRALRRLHRDARWAYMRGYLAAHGDRILGPGAAYHLDPAARMGWAAGGRADGPAAMPDEAFLAVLSAWARGE